MEKENKIGDHLQVENLSTWRGDKRVEFASLIYHGNHLQLLATLNGSFEIILNGEIMYGCIQPYSAIEYYNAIMDNVIDGTYP